MAKIKVYKTERRVKRSPFIIDLRKDRPVGIVRWIWLRAMKGYKFNKGGN